MDAEIVDLVGGDAFHVADEIVDRQLVVHLQAAAGHHR